MKNEEIFQFEKHLESAFSGILSTAGPNIYSSRNVDIAQSPRLEIKAVVGETANHSKAMIDRTRWVYDAYTGSLEIRIVTNRESEKKSGAHHELLGTVRARLQQYYVTQEWAKQKTPLLIMDIRESGTADSFTDENDIDISVLTFAIYFSINPQSWPANL